jgi:hypothetical protein
VYTEFHKVEHLLGSEPDIEGLKQIETEDGHSVNRLERGRYEIVVTGQILTSDDPAAPLSIPNTPSDEVACDPPEDTWSLADRNVAGWAWHWEG